MCSSRNEVSSRIFNTKMDVVVDKYRNMGANGSGLERALVETGRQLCLI